MYALRINLAESAKNKAFLVSIKTTVNQETRNINEACNQTIGVSGEKEERRSVCEYKQSIKTPRAHKDAYTLLNESKQQPLPQRQPSRSQLLAHDVDEVHSVRSNDSNPPYHLLHHLRLLHTLPWPWHLQHQVVVVQPLVRKRFLPNA
jgi:hypothetical protein